ncbi:hypothetical protein [Micromonospora sp. NPDC047074]|uniref:hypothetical protein n=1 Tax=Micromonospora sp. NPDC047074 TaxID=3154339 RepID=UPI0033F114F1
MTSNDHTQPERDTAGAPTQRRGTRGGSSFGLRAAVLAGLVAATAGGAVAAPGFIDDPVRMVSGVSTTCCPPDAL